jgi:hypothetical protein
VMNTKYQGQKNQDIWVKCIGDVVQM